MYLSLQTVPDTPRPGRAADGTRPRRVAPVVLTLGVVSMLTDISSESVAAILPLYLTAVVGLSPAAYGLVDGVYQGVSAFVRIAAGWAADRTGRPWWVAVVGYGLSAVARGVLVIAGGLAAVTALLALDRVGKGIRTAPRDAMIAASSPPEHLGRAFGAHRALDTVGAALGPVIAFAVLWVVPDGYGTVLVVSLGFAVLGVAVLGLLVPPRTGAHDPAPVAAAPDGAGSEPRTRLRDLGSPALRRLVLVAGLLGLFTVGDGFVYLTLFSAGDVAAHWFPLLYVGTNVVFLVLALPVGRLADRVGRARVLVVGHGALAAAYVCAGTASGDLTSVLLTLVLLGASYAATDGVLPALAAPLVPAGRRAGAIAAAQTVVVVARVVASGGFGLLWLLLGPRGAVLLTAALLAAVLPVAWLALRGLDRRRPA